MQYQSIHQSTAHAFAAGLALIPGLDAFNVRGAGIYYRYGVRRA
jgi:hypothetical protein